MNSSKYRILSNLHSVISSESINDQTKTTSKYYVLSYCSNRPSGSKCVCGCRVKVFMYGLWRLSRVEVTYVLLSFLNFPKFFIIFLCVFMCGIIHFHIIFQINRFFFQDMNGVYWFIWQVQEIYFSCNQKFWENIVLPLGLIFLVTSHEIPHDVSYG